MEESGVPTEMVTLVPQSIGVGEEGEMEMLSPAAKAAVARRARTTTRKREARSPRLEDVIESSCCDIRKMGNGRV